jgi:hypothetical protein
MAANLDTGGRADGFGKLEKQALRQIAAANAAASLEQSGGVRLHKGKWILDQEEPFRELPYWVLEPH